MEMLRLLRALGPQYSPRTYVLANTDKMSESKVRALEVDGEGGQWRRARGPRSREVGQPWLASAWTTAVATLYAVGIVLRHMPDVILCNGPGTCVPVCLAAYLPRLLGSRLSALDRRLLFIGLRSCLPGKQNCRCCRNHDS